MRSTGFTLIELLIVIAIIGILAAIAVPMYDSSVRRSENKAAATDVRNITTQAVASSAP